MPRLFSGVEIPPEQAQRLQGLRGGLPGSRWTLPDTYHITLRFLGDVDDVTAQEFASNLTAIRAKCFDLHLDGLGSFGSARPRALWAGLAESEPLAALQRAHEQAAQKAGLPPEQRKFHPHVTLARLRDIRATAVARWLEARGAFLTEPFSVTRFVLYSARASQGGGPYVVEQDFPLD